MPLLYGSHESRCRENRPLVIGKCRSGVAASARNQILDETHPLAQTKNDDTVLSRDNRASRGYERLRPSCDAKQKNTLRQSEILKGPPRQNGILAHHGLQHLSGVSPHGNGREDLALPDVLKNAVDRRKPGTHAVPDPKGFHQRQVGRLVHPDHCFGNMQRLGQQAGENVGLLIPGNGDERVHAVHILLPQ